jgi:flagellar biosynthesis GTPase FlhF
LVAASPEPAPNPALAPNPVPEPVAHTTPPPAPPRPSATDALQRRLLGAGLSRTRANELIGLALEVTDDDEDLTDAVCEEIVAALPRDTALPLAGGAIAIVGSGGSGKTRCVAALAVALARRSARPVSVARLGTAERATELAELVRGETVDVIPAMRTRATVRAVSSARERGLVIIDTPSAGPADRSAIEVLSETLAPFQLDGIYLTVPATFTARAAGKLTEGFAPLGLRGIIATHVDEADQLGVVAELSMQTGLPVSHTHTGVEVTTAITTMDPDELTEVMLP